jgi:hypothetical protein
MLLNVEKRNKAAYWIGSSSERREGDCVKMMNKQSKKQLLIFKLL